MKKYFLLAFVMLFTVAVWAQKKEVKSAEKALKKGDLTTAVESLKAAEGMLAQADDKTKSRFYYVKGMVYQAQAATDPSAYRTAVESYKKVLEFEKEKGLSKYSGEARAKLNELKKTLLAKVDEANKKKDYKSALDYMELVYMIEPTNDNLYILALLQVYNNKLEEGYQGFKKLYESGYTGVKTIYTVKDKETGEVLQVPDPKTQKLLVMQGKYTDPKTEQTKSKRADVVANMLYVLNKMGRDDEAFALIQKAKKEEPNNIDLIIGEANYYLKKDDQKGFTEAMKRAYELDPKNPDYAYNVAIGYMKQKQYDKAREYFQKALNIDPKYKNALYGLALVELAGEDALVEEINKNLNNDRKYNELKKKQLDMYKKALPYLEKYYQIDSNDLNVVRTLMNLYLELDMMDQYKQMRAQYKKLKGQQ